jgi:gamma-glutamylcyclotransferase (GGCT)/AIG2-like uncharacterized protein YtfP
MADCPCLFVYGTLRSGFANHFARQLAAQSEFLGPARVEGRLYRLGHYPGAIPSGGSGDCVAGELYRLHDPAATLAVLDRYEGCGPDDPPPSEFIRLQVPAILASGEAISAWFYAYNCPVTEDRRIPSGDFLA